jgi:hypothetical protein
MAKRFFRLAVLLVAVCPLVSTAACQSASMRSGNLNLHRPDDIAINREQLRLRVRALVGPVTGKIEAAADEIAAESTEASVQRAALEWKIDAVPAMREALFLPTPSMALMDAWVLLQQMADYFDHGPGKIRLGTSSAKAVAACRALEEELTRVAQSGTASGDVSDVRESVRQWAAAHPITGTIAAREPVNSVEFRKDLGDALTVGESAAEIAVTLDDLNRKLVSFSTQLPRQARWEIDRQRRELTDALQSTDARPLAERTVTSVEHVAAAVDRVVPVMEGAAGAGERTRDIIDGERRAAADAIDAGLTRTMVFARGERLAMMAQVTNERIATIDDLHKMIGEEQQALGSEIDQLSFRMIDHAIDRTERFVWQLLAAIVGAVFGGIILVRVLFRRPAGVERQLG